jgi:dTDP-4-amino-4,6-dideoxygalactose transaminase
VETLRSGYLTCGPKVAQFEDALCAATGARHAVAVSNGTAALHIAAIAAGLGPGDEAIVPAMTFAATANAMLYCGAKPVFADIDPETLLMDMGSAAEKANERTKAVFPVHFGGELCDMDAVVDFASERGLQVIQDAAHSLGGTIRGNAQGAYVGMQTWSFHPVKCITTGEGGAVTTNDENLAKKLRLLRSHGITRDAGQFAGAEELVDGGVDADNGGWYYEMLGLGFNYRLSDIQCALGISQLKKLRRFAERRVEIVARYDEAFACSGLQAQRSPVWSSPVRHLYTVRLNDMRKRRAVFDRLRAKGIGVNVHYIPVYLHPYYARLGYRRGLCPVAEDAYERLVTLPLHPKMTDDEVEYVISCVLDAALPLTAA